MRILSTPIAPHQRFWANGRSILTEYISTAGSLVASSLKRFVCMSQTGVSSEGTTEKTRTAFPVFASVNGFRPASTTSKSGAFSPTFSAGPSKVIGLPCNVVAPGRSITCSAAFVISFLFYQFKKLPDFARRQLTGEILTDVAAVGHSVGPGEHSGVRSEQ